MARLHLLYFAWMRERAGRAEEVLDVPPEVATVGALRAWLARPGSGRDAAFAGTGTIRCAVNQEFSADDRVLHDGDEVAFFPPVTGG